MNFLKIFPSTWLHPGLAVELMAAVHTLAVVDATADQHSITVILAYLVCTECYSTKESIDHFLEQLLQFSSLCPTIEVFFSNWLKSGLRIQIRLIALLKNPSNFALFLHYFVYKS